MLSKTDVADLLEVIQQLNKDVFSQYERYQFDIHEKEDGSPVTAVDLFVHDQISEYLKTAFPNTDLVSEESFKSERFLPETCWILDPIDGTKELIHRTGEFCICLALSVRYKASFGIIALPTTGELYVGDLLHQEAYCLEGSSIQPIQVKQRGGHLLLLESRFYKGKQEIALYEKMSLKERITSKPLGAALKFCRVAAGSADGFLRFNDTYAWDSAAGVALVQAAGGSCRLINGRDIEYKWAKHPGFMVEGDQGIFDAYI